MKKALSLLLAGVLCVGLLAGCGGQNSESQSSSTSSTNSTTSSASSTDSSANSTDSSTSTTASSETSNKKIDTLRIAFVPSREPEEIITATEPLKQMLTDELATLGYDVGEVDITVGTSYEAVGEALAAGTADVGLIPGGTYVLYDDGCDVLLTATRDGLSIDSDNAKDWNDNAPTEPTTEQVTSYRALMIAGPSEKGKELAAKVNAGEALTWDDLSKANWAVLKNSSSAGYIYPTLWLQDHYEKKITDLPNVITLAGYGDAFAQAAAEAVDIIVCYADGRNDYEAAWTLPTGQSDETGKAGMGRTDSIWNELNVIGVTPGIYNDTVSITKANADVYNPEFIAAMQQALINVINTPEGQEIFSVYSHTGYAVATDADYDGARAALKVAQ